MHVKHNCHEFIGYQELKVDVKFQDYLPQRG